MTTIAHADALHRRVQGYRCGSMPGRHGIGLRQRLLMPVSMRGVYELHYGQLYVRFYGRHHGGFMARHVDNS